MPHELLFFLVLFMQTLQLASAGGRRLIPDLEEVRLQRRVPLLFSFAIFFTPEAILMLQVFGAHLPDVTRCLLVSHTM